MEFPEKKSLDLEGRTPDRLDMCGIGQKIRELGEKIKKMEEEVIVKLDPTKYTFLRVDGHGFSKFTRPFSKPCDPDLSFAMIQATGEWLKTFGGCTAYTQSDESTLLIPPASIDPETHEPRVMMYSGRVTKLSTLSAGYFSSRFNHHLTVKSVGTSDLRKSKQMTSGLAYFDCRVFQCDASDVPDVFLWRKLDAYRNGVNSLARSLFSTKQLFRCNVEKQLSMINEADSTMVGTFPHLTQGTWVKKTLVEKNCVNEYTQEQVKVVRTELVFVHHEVDVLSQYKVN